MKTELRFTDERVPHIALIWDQATTFSIRIDGQTVDTFPLGSDEPRTPGLLEQAQQAALRWFDEVVASQAYR
jgi:hypothetical protein